MKNLIINSDDYGFTPKVSEGIRIAYLEGVLTSTTAMAGGESITSDIKILKKDCPKIGLGVHLTLTTLTPLLPNFLTKSLTNENGSFFSLKELNERKSFLKASEIYNEWKAQIEFLLDLGVEIDHIDSHHYVCFLTKETTEVTIQLAKEYKIPVRTPSHPFDDKTVERYAREELDKKNVNYPDYFSADFTRNKGTKSSLEVLLRDIKPGNSEILAHAGIVDDNLRKKSSLNDSREVELNTLTSNDISELIKELDINLTTFSNIF